MTRPTTAPEASELRKLEEQLDPEVRFRPLQPAAAMFVALLLFLLSCFHYYTAGFGLLRETTHRGIHMAFVLSLIFLVFSARRTDPTQPPPVRWWRPLGIGLHDWACALAAVVGALYVPWIYDDLAFIVGNPRPIDALIGTGLIVVMLEATRRSVGWPLPAIAVALMLYALYGRQMPGILVHAGTTWKGLVDHLYLTSQGIFGIALGVVATYVFHYVLFGVLATRIGLGRLFLDLANALMGRYAGGPAKVSIVGSAMFGMISGSSIANTVTVGSLTIPAMIRLGYPKHFAAAVESTASTGGQITPPIMGAAAFLMVEFLNVPYQQIILAAVVPAFLHFFGVFWQVHFEARKNGMKGLPAADLPRVRAVLAEGWPTSIPLFVLLLVLFSGYTPYLAAFWGITACLIVGLTRRNGAVALGMLAVLVAATFAGALEEGWATVALLALGAAVAAAFLLRDPHASARLLDMGDAFVVGAKYAIAVGAAAATVGVIVGVVTLTGVGFKISNIVTTFAGTLAGWSLDILPEWLFTTRALTLFYTLVMTAIVCILLGCGVPTTANYIIMVTVAAPALVQLGVEPIVAHFFVFYYGVLADITPPVALAAYAAASMAGADPFRTGNTAFRLGMAKALVPFVFVYAPAMLIVTKGFTWYGFLETALTTAGGVLFLAIALTGHMISRLPLGPRLALGLGGVLLMAPGLTTALIGVLAAVPAFAQQAWSHRAKAPVSG
ncbi:MAG: TRAP transporter permease [Alphaproteobacteria bacterium]|nr:TRAP transporter permease [Alphaproteobacteria bacterium]